MKKIPSELEVLKRLLERLEIIEELLHLAAVSYVTDRDEALGSFLSSAQTGVEDTREMVRLTIGYKFRNETLH